MRKDNDVITQERMDTFVVYYFLRQNKSVACFKQ